MVTYNCRVDFETWRDILQDFSEMVYEKRYEKMPYHIWREMWNLTEHDASEICFYWEVGPDNTAEIKIYPAGQPSKVWPCVRWDFSFGDFVYENLLRGYENMPTKKNNESNDRVYYDAYYDNPYYTTDSTGVMFKADVAASEAYGRNSIFDTKANLEDVQKLERTVSELCESATLTAPIKEKENKNMKFNFDFGPVNNNTVRMSLYGLAVKNKAGTWVSYDAKSGDIMDVDVLNFDGAKFLYKMPVAIKDIAIGDVIVHNGIPMFVIAVAVNGNYITAVDPVNGERKDIMLPRSPFGFNFATKVINFLGNALTGTATAENPFGNMWMLMMMEGDSKGDMGDILPFLMMNNATATMDSNMLMFMALSHINGGSKDMLPWLMMMNANNAGTHTCNCGGHCGENHTQG